MLLQVAMTLAVAEQACEFEHRDLHWGNVLLSRSKDARQAAAIDRGSMGFVLPPTHLMDSWGQGFAHSIHTTPPLFDTYIWWLLTWLGSCSLHSLTCPLSPTNPAPREVSRCKLRGVPIEMRTGGLEVTVIDFTLSRQGRPAQAQPSFGSAVAPSRRRQIGSRSR